MTTRRVVSTVAVLGVLVCASPQEAGRGAVTPPVAPDPAQRASSPAVPAASGIRPASPSSGLDLVVLSRIVAAPSYVRSRVRLTPHPAQQVLRVTVDSPGFARTTEVTLTGDGAPADCHFYWRDLPPGLYDMVATVHGANGDVLSQRRLSFAVVGGVSAG